MKNQKVIIISVVTTILLLAIIGISILLNNQIKAANCSHSSWELVSDENYHWNQCTSCGDVVFEMEVHRYVHEVCVTCGYSCEHPSYTNGYCTNCGTEEEVCEHETWKFAYNDSQHWNKCTSCEEIVFEKENHQYVDGVCVICEYVCMHNAYVNGYCAECTYACEHSRYENGICLNCGLAGQCSHSEWKLTWDVTYHWNECTSCKAVLFEKEVHRYVDGVCVTCQYTCKHPTNTNGSCTNCGIHLQQQCTHPTWVLVWNQNYHWNQCTSCGVELFGREIHRYVNGVCTTCTYTCKHPTYTNGYCTNCGVAGQCNHLTWILTWDENYHWNQCTSCRKELFGKEAHAFVNGSCVTCKYNCNHAELIWLSDETEHWEACNKCFGEVLGTRATHTYSNGTCTICSYKCEHKSLEWKSNEKEHWQICKTCSGEVVNTRKAHTITEWKDQGNGTHTGTCTVCNIKLQENHTYENDKCNCGAEKECTHENKQWNLGETEHWQTCTKCNKEIEGTRGTHTYKNGVCTTCTYSCKHSSKTWEKDVDAHWEKCETCLCEIAGTRSTHTITEWKDQENGTHIGTCTVCDIKLQENHTFENEKCKCGAVKEQEPVECKHDETKWLAISTEHWKVCKNCEQEIAETRGKHTFENGRCKECNYVCKHDKVEWKNNETEHWQVCENCLGEVEGTREAHTYEDNKCTKCSIVKVEDNNNPTDDNDNNNQTDNNNSGNNDNNNSGSNENNNTSTDKDNNGSSTDTDKDTSNEEDTTQKGDKIPDTGIESESMRIAIMITSAIIGCALLIKLSRKED